MAVSAPSGSFTKRQVAKLQGRGAGIAVSADGVITREGQVVGQSDPQTELHSHLRTLALNIDPMGDEYRYGAGDHDPAPDDLQQIAALPIEIMLLPAPNNGAQIRVGRETAQFADVETARDMAKLFEDYPQLARDLLAGRGIDLEQGLKPTLATLDAAADRPQTPAPDSPALDV
jgi:hypothetical protein